jgi:hypothetical protein
MSTSAIFSAWRNSMTHLCFVGTSMSDAIFPHCSTSDVCRRATKLTNYWREGSTSTAISPASTSDVVGHIIKHETLLSKCPLYFVLKKSILSPFPMYKSLIEWCKSIFSLKIQMYLNQFDSLPYSTFRKVKICAEGDNMHKIRGKMSFARF